MVWQENARIIVCLTNISEAKTVCLFFISNMFEKNNRKLFCVCSHRNLDSLLYCLTTAIIIHYKLVIVTLEKMCKVLAGPQR